MKDYKHEGFYELAENGFISEYVHIDHETGAWSPAVSLEHALKCGFKPKGTRLRFNNHHGHDYQREEAAKFFDESLYYTVQECSIGRNSSTYRFEGIPHSWNTVMFSE